MCPPPTSLVESLVTLPLSCEGRFPGPVRLGSEEEVSGPEEGP